MSLLYIATQAEDGEEIAGEKINGRLAAFVFMSEVANLVLI